MRNTLPLPRISPRFRAERALNASIDLGPSPLAQHSAEPADQDGSGADLVRVDLDCPAVGTDGVCDALDLLAIGLVVGRAEVICRPSGLSR